VVESELVGGECAYWGCIPTKTLIRSAETLQEARRARELAASSVEFKVDFPKAAARTAWMTREWDDTSAAKALEDEGATVFRSRGRLAGPKRVELADGTVLVARRSVVVATGTKPSVPPIPGLERIEYWTNRDAVRAKTLPASLIVLGGGAVGVELAQAFSRFGSEVTVVEGGPRLIAAEEPEAGELLATVLREEGLTVLTGGGVAGVEPAANGGVRVSVVGRDVPLEAERLLVAAGRRPNLDGFDLAAAGVSATQRGFLQVDRETLVAAEGVYGGGDITGIYGFTHVSHYHGVLIAQSLRGQPRRANHSAIPRVTFTDPEVASVGVSEEAARSAGADLGVAHADVAKSGRGYIHDVKHGFVKLVADRREGVLVGATLFTPRAGEMIAELSLAVRAKIPLKVLDDHVHGFPTFSRILQGAFHQLV
jgi:pyruvate/2-oxoglutarate dehydrogenase complex dihydrolipoamide dehydrogenase (E3) component